MCSLAKVGINFVEVRSQLCLMSRLFILRLAYAIMFDAGSTGSRIHIFQIRIQNGEYKLDNETYDRVSPGLSDYASDPLTGALSLK